MNIADWVRKGKEALSVAILLLLVSAAFGVGYLTGRDAGQGSELSVSKIPLTEATTSWPAGGGYVASKTGSKYYLPWCGGAKSIKVENKIQFATRADAESAGYTPAANCKGI